MDYSRILKRALEITRKYPVLWIFGFFVAGGSGVSGNFNVPGGGHWKNTDKFFKGIERGGQELPHLISVEVLILIGLLVFLIFLVLMVLQYVSMTALPRMVDRIESSESHISFSMGWKLGWSKRAWNVFGISVVAFLVAVAVLLLVGGGLIGVPLYFLIRHGHSSTMGIILKMLPLGLLALVLLLVALVTIGLVKRFAHYHAAVAGTNVVESIGWSIRAFKENLGSILLMWLIMIGVNIIAGLIMLLGIIVLALITLMVAGGIGWVLWKTVGEILALIVGILLGTATFLLPLLVLASAIGTYKVVAWVLVYREIKERERGLLPSEEVVPAS